MTARPDGQVLYPIRAVSRLTGIAIDTLRAWERRYGAVAPVRDERGRLYSESDVARLRLIGQAVAMGHGVGRIARLSDDDLRKLTEIPAAVSPARPGLVPARPSVPVPDTGSFSFALMRFDSAALDRELSRLASVLPPLELVRDAIMPALREAGDQWNERPAGIAQEHLMSSTMRSLLGSFLRLYCRRDHSTRLLFATPSGERHEMGVLGAAMLAAERGFEVSYVGPDLPARDLVDAVKAAGAHVLVLGLTLGGHGGAIDRELRALLRDLPAGIEIWAGGPAAETRAPLLGTRALVLRDFDAYVRQLERLGRRAT